jgi:hypothetical protein
MDYDLEKLIRLNNKTEHKSLYSWCLEEVGTDGNKTGNDLVPWEWRIYFTASELRLRQGFEIDELPDLYDTEGESELAQKKKFNNTEAITATLHPGICDDGKWLEGDTRFSMFGTDRVINEFSLNIYMVESEEDERHSIWGGVSYTSEVDYGYETLPDTIGVILALSPARFNKLAQLISKKEIDIARISLSRVSGFYSEWSPSISTKSVKVLVKGDDQQLIKPDGCEIEPPRLGEIGEMDLMLITRCKLNIKQNLATLNISELFNDETPYEEEVLTGESEDLTNILLVKLAHNQAEIMKLKTPLWIAVFLLGALTLPTWF